jgi:hypothetical protein
VMIGLLFWSKAVPTPIATVETEIDWLATADEPLRAGYG